MVNYTLEYTPETQRLYSKDTIKYRYYKEKTLKVLNRGRFHMLIIYESPTDNPVELEEWEYHWALSDISGFVVKYGLDRVLKDITDFIDLQDQQCLNRTS